MEIQSLSICVPAKACMNKCKFCVSRMHNDTYPDFITSDISAGIVSRERDYIKRLEYARDNGCNTVMLTGQAEPQQNKAFLEKFALMNRSLPSPFKNIEMQTTGAGIDNNYLDFLADTVGVTTISLSVSSLTSDKVNNEIIGTVGDKNFINLTTLCKNIKAHNINLRLSLNITSKLVETTDPIISHIFTLCQMLDADQITFRRMYSSEADTEQDKWIAENSIVCINDWFDELNQYIKDKGKYIDTLEYGNKRYSVNGMSTVVDEDCMAKSEDKQSLKYLILRPNCKLYSQWDDKASLIF